MTDRRLREGFPPVVKSILHLALTLPVALAAMSPAPPAPYPPPPEVARWTAMPAAERLASIESRVRAPLEGEMRARGFTVGGEAFLRVFKESAEMELWLRPGARGPFSLFRTYSIAAMSGTLGPKVKEGDMQAPEGCYATTKRLLNLNSRYHVSFNIGYPNALDQHHQRTGSLIMVHGKNVSIGCFAMTDLVIEEIFLLVKAALDAGQAEVPVHCFPFRMTDERLARAGAEGSPWLPFWQDLRAVHDAFDQTRLPPAITVQNGRYRIAPATRP